MSLTHIVRVFLRDVVKEIVGYQDAGIAPVSPVILPANPVPDVPVVADEEIQTLESKLADLLGDSRFEYRKLTTLVAETGRSTGDVVAALESMGAEKAHKTGTGEVLYKLA